MKGLCKIVLRRGCIEYNVWKEMLLTTLEAAWYNFIIILAVSVGLSVYQTITFESLDVGSSYLHIRCISTEYGPSSYI